MPFYILWDMTGQGASLFRAGKLNTIAELTGVSSTVMSTQIHADLRKETGIFENYMTNFFAKDDIVDEVMVNLVFFKHGSRQVRFLTESRVDHGVRTLRLSKRKWLRS